MSTDSKTTSIPQKGFDDPIIANKTKPGEKFEDPLVATKIKPPTIKPQVPPPPTKP